MSVGMIDLNGELGHGVEVAALLDALRARQRLNWSALGEMVFMAAIPGEGSPWSFRTGSLEVISTGDGPGQMVIDLMDMVFPLRPKRDGAFRQTLLVGRASSNDIQIPHSSVSKLHARIDLSATPTKLADADSRNGTRLNEKRLAPDIYTNIGPGDFIDLGDVGVRVVSVASLETAITRMAS